MSRSKGRDILSGLTSEGPRASGTQVQSSAQRTPGAIRALNLSLGKLNEEAAAAKALREAIAAGESVVSLDVDLVDRSFVQDRLSGNSATAYIELKRSIEHSGQQVPILVRPHPEHAGRYQIAYGHRRHQVARDLGRTVSAVVRPLTDKELLLAQGQENGQRADLTFIERARFARTLDERGYDREFISMALGVDKPESSRLLQVANGIPDDVILAIGPAEKIGRPRWLAIAERLKSKAALRSVTTELELPEVQALDTNRRFERVWKLVSKKEGIQDPKFIRLPTGTIVGSIAKSKSGAKITLLNQDFAEFLLQRLDSLASVFEEKKRKEIR